jgi:hypothetical protein
MDKVFSCSRNTIGIYLKIIPAGKRRNVGEAPREILKFIHSEITQLE